MSLILIQSLRVLIVALIYFQVSSTTSGLSFIPTAIITLFIFSLDALVYIIVFMKMQQSFLKADSILLGDIIGQRATMTLVFYILKLNSVLPQDKRKDM
jgi:F0F1-type ATP synthase assembly protein I